MKKEELEKKLKIYKVISIISMIFICIMAVISVYLYNSYKNNSNNNNNIESEDFVYKLSGENDNFLYYNAYFMRVGRRYYLHYGDIEIKNKDIKKTTKVTLKCDDRLIIGTTEFLTGTSEENKGYDELFPQEVVENIDSWYFEITYIDGKKEKTDILKLDNYMIESLKEDSEHI